MNLTLSFVKILLLTISTVFFTTYAISYSYLFEGLHWTIAAMIGTLSGLIFGLALIGMENSMKQFNLKSFNTAAFGLFCGYLMGKAILILFNAIIMPIQLEMQSLIQIIVMLSTSYLGMMMAVRASEEIYASIPFVKFKPESQTKKDLIADASVLQDSRLIDLASSGLIDNVLLIPRFLVKEFQLLADSPEENQKNKGRRGLEIIKKLESTPQLNARYSDLDFPEIKDQSARLAKIGSSLDAYILTADMSRMQQSSSEGIRVINLHTLSNALKPVTQTGEYLNIKIQRYGKEARQGVGYLDDGTMVVVNGGAEYIGETIKAQVLSTKHTLSGRMIFCNATDENGVPNPELVQAVSEMETASRNYFAQ